MALVAYASSDEDEVIEADEPEATFAEEDPSDVKQNSLFAKLPAPKSLDDFEEPELIIAPSAKEMALREKPPPPPRPPILDQAAMSSLPPPQKKKKIIQLPSLPLVDSDDDDEEDEKPKPFIFSSYESSDKSVFGNLPKPKNTSGKEVGRALLPHTLTKRQRQSTATTSRTQSKPSAINEKTINKSASSKEENASGILLAANYESEDEDDDAGMTTSNYFFSGTGNEASKQSELSRINISLAPKVDVSEVSKRIYTVRAPVKSIVENMDMDAADAPLLFSKENRVVDGSVVTTAPYSDHHTSEGYDPAWLTSGDNVDSYESMQCDEFPESTMAEDNASLLQSQLGKKRKRGQEDITFIDINLADHLNSSSLELTKNLTVETSMKSHSKKRNKDMPTSQQKRKHQITFLAHQAKERELELKNQWSENKFSKKQTQSKYGF